MGLGGPTFSGKALVNYLNDRKGYFIGMTVHEFRPKLKVYDAAFIQYKDGRARTIRLFRAPTKRKVLAKANKFGREWHAKRKRKT